MFDSSFKQKNINKLYLNDCLLKEPNFLEQIPAVLMKFRQVEIAVISDIKKAFPQISVAKQNREYVKFLWYGEEVHRKVFQHSRAVFGLNCRPFFLNVVLRFHLEKVRSSFNSIPFISKIVEKFSTSFYFNNCVNSVKSTVELKQFIDISEKVMAEAKFHLQG